MDSEGLEVSLFEWAPVKVIKGGCQMTIIYERKIIKPSYIARS